MDENIFCHPVSLSCAKSQDRGNEDKRGFPIKTFGNDKRVESKPAFVNFIDSAIASQRRMTILIILLFAAFVFSSCASKPKTVFVLSSESVPAKKTEAIVLHPAPLAFGDVPRDMKSAGYWISKIKNPDAEILDRKGINSLNAKTTNVSMFLKDIRYFPPRYSGRMAEDKLKKALSAFAKHYDGSGEEPVGKEYFLEIADNVDFELLRSTVTVRFAMTINFAQLRAIPFDKPLYSSLDTLDIDRVQFTLLDLGSPLAILYQTKDKKWLYAVSEIAEGWISRDSVAFCTQDDIKKHKSWKNTAVTISANTDIFKDKFMKNFLFSVKMGTQLQFYKIYDNYVEIRIPGADKNGRLEYKKAAVASSDIHEGFLKYTQRNVLIQAFRNLNQPYGWGGMNGDQDCSAFLKQVFACFGIILPRNSTGQSQVGAFFMGFDANESETARAERIIKHGTPGATFLYFPGHIMLYIGHDNKKPYVIHSVRGYAEDDTNLSNVYLLNKVAVTTLNIGEDSKKGSFLKRTTLMRTVK
ncbi:MAG: NlpC/P60 family protein [Endomicrobia bacterium]|nr:NlpC/P60 family protein [Endomicrobiia bacterium]MCL2507379.1 NlpC/P60 family protein [Endomicrobiia bacterium]